MTEVYEIARVRDRIPPAALIYCRNEAAHERKIYVDEVLQ